MEKQQSFTETLMIIDSLIIAEILYVKWSVIASSVIHFCLKIAQEMQLIADNPRLILLRQCSSWNVHAVYHRA